MSGSLTQFGIGPETTWGTAVAVTKFFEITKESIRGKYSRVESAGLSASYVARTGRYVIGTTGAAGSVDFEPLTLGFGHWLYYMLGAVATTGPTETSCYTHTGTIDDQYDKSFTCQVGRATEDGTVVPWTFEGGRVTSFELSNTYEEILKCTVDMDFEKESCPDSPTTPYDLQTANLPSGAEVFSWLGGEIKVGGTVVDVTDVSIKVDNKLETELPFINKSKTKKQPILNGQREITWSFKSNYNNQDFWKKVASSTIAGAQAELICSWEGMTLLGTTLYPKITVTIPVARFDEGEPVVEGPGLLEATYNGKGFYNGTDSAIEIEVISGDTTVLPN